MDKDRDSALLEDCKRGDRQALDSLVRRYERPVFNAAFRMLGNRDEAADVTQTVFLKAFENLDRYDPKYKFFSWIYRIAVNTSIDHLNSRRRNEPLAGDLVAEGGAPETLVEEAGVSVALQDALMELQEDYRSVIVLRHFTDYSYKEISQILDIPEKTVKSRLFSARQRMKDSLGKKGVLSA